MSTQGTFVIFLYYFHFFFFFNNFVNLELIQFFFQVGPRQSPPRGGPGDSMHISSLYTALKKKGVLSAIQEKNAP